MKWNNKRISKRALEDFLGENGTELIFSGYTVLLCLSGKCTLKLSGGSEEIRGGTLLILSPGQLTGLDGTSENLDTRSVTVSFDEIINLPSPMDIDILEASHKTPVTGLSREETMRLLDYFDFVQRHNDPANIYHEEISTSLLYTLILEICDILNRHHDNTGPDMASDPTTARTDADTGAGSGKKRKNTKPKQENLTDDFFRLLYLHFRSEHNVGFYAEKLNRTPKYLSTAIRRISGKSVPYWISTALTSEIRRLLKTTDMTITEISEELNFSSPSVLVQFFRHNTGVTPLQYRKLD